MIEALWFCCWSFLANSFARVDLPAPESPVNQITLLNFFLIISMMIIYLDFFEETISIFALSFKEPTK